MPASTAEMPTITAEKVRRLFSPVMGKVSFGHTPHVITNRGNPTMVWISVDDYEDMLDLMDTMAEQLSPKFQESLRKSHEEYERGEVGTEEDVDSILRAKMKYAKTKI